MLKFLKTYALFLSMMLGIVAHNIFTDVSFATKYFMDEPLTDITFITKYMLFVMLLITYCKISPKQMKANKLHYWLAIIQLGGCFLVYALLYYFNEHAAEGALICILTPTATSAPVITGLLGGSVACLATYSIASNLAIALIAPLVFSILGAHGAAEADLTFFQAFLIICQKVVPLALFPFFLAILLKKFVPKVHEYIKTRQGISFWLWVIALALLMARTTNDLLKMDPSLQKSAFIVASVALVVCLLLFIIGRHVGTRFENTVAGGQAFGQKNTILAIWMAQTFFNPLVAIAPASYVLWQNLVNSFQMWKHNRKS